MPMRQRKEIQEVLLAVADPDKGLRGFSAKTFVALCGSQGVTLESEPQGGEDADASPSR